jgi:RNA polymerase sigma-70 factor (ECF subfamily)
MHAEISTLLTQNKTEEAFNLIVKSYSQRLYWHVRRLVLDHDDADDVVQNTFIKIWKGLPNFRQDSNVYTWIYRIATNEALSFLRSKKENTRFEDVEYSLSQNLEADAFFDGDAAQASLVAAVATLPEKQRAVFNLRYFEEMSYAEMSAVFDTSEGALKASYHHAVKKIEAYMQKH